MDDEPEPAFDPNGDADDDLEEHSPEELEESLDEAREDWSGSKSYRPFAREGEVDPDEAGDV